MRRHAPWIVLAGLLLMAADDPKQKEELTKKDAEKLQGTWILAASEQGGKELRQEESKKTRVHVQGDMMRVRTGEEGDDSVRFMLDPIKTPKAIDATILEGRDKNKVVRGIYRFDGETVTFCWSPPGEERPDEFITKPGSDRRLMVLKPADR